jgi:hypothetical protein
MALNGLVAAPVIVLGIKEEDHERLLPSPS